MGLIRDVPLFPVIIKIQSLQQQDARLNAAFARMQATVPSVH